MIMDFVSYLTSWGASSRGGLEYATVAEFRLVTDEPVEFQGKKGGS